MLLLPEADRPIGFLSSYGDEIGKARRLCSNFARHLVAMQGIMRIISPINQTGYYEQKSNK